MEYTNKIFDFVEKNAPEIWEQMVNITKLHKMSSVKAIFNEHLKSIEDIEIFNENQERIPIFLLEFCKSIQRNFLSPGENYGTILTSRVTNAYTQNTLDRRHLKEPNSDSIQFNFPIDNAFKFEFYIYTTLNQIFEISNRRKYTTIFVKNYEIVDLLNLNPSETCYMKMINGECTTLNNEYVSLYLRKYIITESFIPGYLKIILKPESKNFIYRRIEHKNIFGFTDLKHVNEKQGLICFIFNQYNIIKLQFFKKMHLGSRHERDILNVLRYQYYTGMLLSLNRNGLKHNKYRSGLDKLSFEAVKQRYVTESIKNTEYKVQTPIDCLFYGQQPHIGTGYNFALLPNKIRKSKYSKVKKKKN